MEYQHAFMAEQDWKTRYIEAYKLWRSETDGKSQYSNDIYALIRNLRNKFAETGYASPEETAKLRVYLEKAEQQELLTMMTEGVIVLAALSIARNGFLKKLFVGGALGLVGGSIGHGYLLWRDRQDLARLPRLEN